MKDLVFKVSKEAEKNINYVKNLCSELVKIPSVNPPGMTKDIVVYIKFAGHRASTDLGNNGTTIV